MIACMKDFFGAGSVSSLLSSHWLIVALILPVGFSSCGSAFLRGSLSSVWISTIIWQLFMLRQFWIFASCAVVAWMGGDHWLMCHSMIGGVAGSGSLQFSFGSPESLPVCHWPFVWLLSAWLLWSQCLWVFCFLFLFICNPFYMQRCTLCYMVSWMQCSLCCCWWSILPKLSEGHWQCQVCAVVQVWGVLFPTAALEAECKVLSTRLTLFGWCNISVYMTKSSGAVEEGKSVGDVVLWGK